MSYIKQIESFDVVLSFLCIANGKETLFSIIPLVSKNGWLLLFKMHFVGTLNSWFGIPTKTTKISAPRRLMISQ